MFDLWQKIVEKGALAIPVREESLSPLEWAEVSEHYSELVPSAYRGYDVYSDNDLIRECPFVRVGDAYKFRTGELDVFVNTRELVDMLCAKDYHIGMEESFRAGALTCSCGIRDCDGIDSQTVHVSERMVRWDVCRYGQKYKLFFEREAYDVGVVRMLHDLCQSDSGIDYNVGDGYESSDSATEGVCRLLAWHPYYADIWEECGFMAIESMKCKADLFDRTDRAKETKQ